jgi:hypothetical protein
MLKNTSLSNKGKLSTWKIHEVSDLTSIVETIYKAGPTMAIADPLSRLARQEDRVENLDLPVLLQMLLRELHPSIKMAERIRVNTEKDTYVVTRIVQRWRTPTNSISNTIGASLESFDFLIAAPHANKLLLKVAEYIRKDIPFVILILLTLLNEIDRISKTEIDQDVRKKRLQMKLIVSSSLGQVWLKNHPECLVKDTAHSVFFTQLAHSPELNTASQKICNDWSANYLGYDEVGTQSFLPSILPGGQDMDEVALLAIDSLFRNGATRTNETVLMGEATPATRSERAARRAQPSTSRSKPPRRALHKPAQTTAPKPSSRDARATKRKQQNISASNEDAYDHPDKECYRTVLTRSNAQTPRNPHPSAWDPTSFSMLEGRARVTMRMNQHRATIHPVVNATLVNVATQKTLRKATTIHHSHQTQKMSTLNDGYHMNGRGQRKATETSRYVSVAFSFKCPQE